MEKELKTLYTVYFAVAALLISGMLGGAALM